MVVRQFFDQRLNRFDRHLALQDFVHYYSLSSVNHSARIADTIALG